MSTRAALRRALEASVVLFVFAILAAGSLCHESSESARGADAHPAGKTPPIPEGGRLGEPRSLEQVGLPPTLTRSVIPPDNVQTPEKIALGKRLGWEGQVARGSSHIPHHQSGGNGAARPECGRLEDCRHPGVPTGIQAGFPPRT